MDRLGIADLLAEIGMTQNQSKRTMASIIARMLSPGSELHTADWIQNQSSIMSLLDLESAHYRSLYRCATKLYKHRHQFIEKIMDNYWMTPILSERIEWKHMHS